LDLNVFVEDGRNMDFKKYLQRKQQLQNNIGATVTLLDELQLRHARERLLNDRHKLEDEKFSLVVIGEFSRGKSTFVNAMLGKSILPSSKQPTTNIISKIIYGNRPSYTIFYKDGKSKHVTDEEFLEIKAQAEADPSNLEKVKNFFKKTEDFSKIKYAEVAYPLSFCQNNVEVVDTPGTNDLNVGRVEITYDYLKNAEAAILVLGADQALSKSEKEFLRERVIGNQIQDIFIVINYKDMLDGAKQEEEVKQYVLKNLSDLGDFSKRIFMVSSKQALLYRRKESGEALKAKMALMVPDTIEETGFPEFENALAHFLSEEKGLTKLKKYVSCCEGALVEIESSLKTRKEAASHSADDLRTRLREQRPKYEQTKAEAIRITQRLRSQLLLGESSLEQKADLTANRIKQAAVKAIDNYHGNMSSQDIQYLIDKAVTPIEKQFIEDTNKMQKQFISDGIAEALRQLQRIWKDMDFSADTLPIIPKIKSLSGVSMNEVYKTDVASLVTFGAPYAVAGYLIGGLLVANPVVGIFALAAGKNMLANLFNYGVKRQEEEEKEQRRIRVKEQVRKQYNEALKGFTTQVAQQYRKTVDEICNSMRKEIDNRLETMEEQLQSLIVVKESKERDAEKEARVLDQQYSEVKRIRARLAEVVKE
jgi:GTPase SAR1 family protein